MPKIITEKDVIEFSKEHILSSLVRMKLRVLTELTEIQPLFVSVLNTKELKIEIIYEHEYIESFFDEYHEHDGEEPVEIKGGYTVLSIGYADCENVNLVFENDLKTLFAILAENFDMNVIGEKMHQLYLEANKGELEKISVGWQNHAVEKIELSGRKVVIEMKDGFEFTLTKEQYESAVNKQKNKLKVE